MIIHCCVDMICITTAICSYTAHQAHTPVDDNSRVYQHLPNRLGHQTHLEEVDPLT